MDLHVGGLKVPGDDSEHEAVHWVDGSSIQIGDELVIRVKEAQAAHAPVPPPQATPPEDEREAFDDARDTYFRLRQKYPLDS